MNTCRRNRSYRHHQNSHGSDRARDRKRTQAQSQCLRHRTDEIDLTVSNQSQNRAGAENEHQRDDRRSDHDRAADIARRGARFACKDRNVLKSTQAADRQFAENVETIKDRHRGDSELERMILLQFATREADEGQNDKGAIGQKHGEPADVVDPFA